MKICDFCLCTFGCTNCKNVTNYTVCTWAQITGYPQFLNKNISIIGAQEAIKTYIQSLPVMTQTLNILNTDVSSLMPHVQMRVLTRIYTVSPFNYLGLNAKTQQALVLNQKWIPAFWGEAHTPRGRGYLADFQWIRQTFSACFSLI